MCGKLARGPQLRSPRDGAWRLGLLLPLVAWSFACEPPAARRGVVSLSPLATRLVVALGGAKRLVAVDPVSAELLGRQGLAPLEVADFEAALALEPDLLLAPALPDPLPRRGAELVTRGSRLIAFEPHDFEDVIALVREVGGALVGAEATLRFERAISRPLAAIGGASKGQPRPRVAAVVDVAPLTLAGGHSFETDLIEIAGGTSVTHAGAEPRLELSVGQWRALDADLVLVFVALDPAEHEGVRNVLSVDAEIGFFSFDPDFWLDPDPAKPARRLRKLHIEPLARRAAATKERRPHEPGSARFR